MFSVHVLLCGIGVGFSRSPAEQEPLGRTEEIHTFVTNSLISYFRVQCTTFYQKMFRNVLPTGLPERFSSLLPDCVTSLEENEKHSHGTNLPK